MLKRLGKFDAAERVPGDRIRKLFVHPRSIAGVTASTQPIVQLQFNLKCPNLISLPRPVNMG
jgi:hypothetical protein